jgi:hypothetical protein
MHMQLAWHSLHCATGWDVILICPGNHLTCDIDAEAWHRALRKLSG